MQSPVSLWLEALAGAMHDEAADERAADASCNCSQHARTHMVCCTLHATMPPCYHATVPTCHHAQAWLCRKQTLVLVLRSVWLEALAGAMHDKAADVRTAGTAAMAATYHSLDAPSTRAWLAAAEPDQARCSHSCICASPSSVAWDHTNKFVLLVTVLGKAASTCECTNHVTSCRMPRQESKLRGVSLPDVKQARSLAWALRDSIPSLQQEASLSSLGSTLASQPSADGRPGPGEVQTPRAGPEHARQAHAAAAGAARTPRADAGKRQADDSDNQAPAGPAADPADQPQRSTGDERQQAGGDREEPCFDNHSAAQPQTDQPKAPQSQPAAKPGHTSKPAPEHDALRGHSARAVHVVVAAGGPEQPRQDTGQDRAAAQPDRHDLSEASQTCVSAAGSAATGQPEPATQQHSVLTAEPQAVPDITWQPVQQQPPQVPSNATQRAQVDSRHESTAAAGFEAGEQPASQVRAFGLLPRHSESGTSTDALAFVGHV